MLVKKELKITLILCILNLTNGHAQLMYSFNQPSASRTSHAQYIYSLNQYLSPDGLDIQGSPFLKDAFTKSQVYSDKGNFHDIEMRYNIYYDRMEFKEEGVLYALDPNLLVQKIELGSQIFVVDFYEEKGTLTPMYLERLDSGKVILTAKLRVLFKERQQGKPIEGDIPASYNRLPDNYYFKVGKGALLKVRSIKKLIDALPDQKKKMLEFAKKEKISANKKDELTKFMAYYNSLSEN